MIAYMHLQLIGTSQKASRKTDTVAIGLKKLWRTVHVRLSEDIDMDRRLGRVSNEKIDSHRFSGLASRCVEWFDPNIKRTDREAPSPFFLQEKIKTLEITGRS